MSVNLSEIEALWLRERLLAAEERGEDSMMSLAALRVFVARIEKALGFGE